MPLRSIVLLLFFVGSLPVCFIRPFYGVLLWTIVAFLNPQAYLWGTASFFPWALAVAIPTLFGSFLFGRGWRALASREVFLILTLWAWFTLTSALSSHTGMFEHHAPDTWERLRLVSKILLMTLATIAIVDSLERLRLLVLTIAGCFGIFILKAFPFIIASGGAFRLYGPPDSMIADNNDFGLALNMTLPILFFLAYTEAKRWMRWLFGFLFVIGIPAVFFTYSRGALVGVVAVLSLMLLRSKQRIALIPVLALGIAVALMFAPEAWKERMNPTREGALDNSALERLNAWSFAWNLATDYPIAGGGFATFTPQLFARYAPDAGDIHGPHSVYFQILAEHGFVGLFLYLALVLACFLVAGRLARRARARGDPLVAGYTNMFRFSLVGFLASGAFLGRAYFDYFFTIVACLVVLDRVARQTWERESEEVVLQEGGELSLADGEAAFEAR